jgi:hypothetical protein
MERSHAMPTLALFALLISLSAVAGCSNEKPSQQLVQSEEAAQQRDQRAAEDARRQRTLGQSESDRIYNQGGLR